MSETIVQDATVIRVGGDMYVVTSTKDGRGVRVENAQGSLFIPKGDEGVAIAKALAKAVSGNVDVKVNGQAVKAVATSTDAPYGYNADGSPRLRRTPEQVKAEKDAKAKAWEAKQALWKANREAKGK